MTDILIPCVVENGFNTCYIDSLLVSLFYKNNDNILNKTGRYLFTRNY